MATVAEQLRRAREEKGLSVAQVVEVTKMRSDHVHALEQGDYTIFNAPVYIRGFVRTYATLLKLNVPDLMRQLEADLGQPGGAGETPPSTQGSGGALDGFLLALSKVDWAKAGIVLLAIAAVATLLVSFVYQSARRGANPLAGEKPRLYESRSNSGETLPVPVPVKAR